jgi:hypothetical protein
LLVAADDKKAAKAAGDTSQPQRSRSMGQGVLRGTWTSWDSELLQMLPGDVRRQLPVVLNSGCAIHRPLFDDLCSEVAAGRRSFEEWVRSHLRHQHHLYYNGLREWLSYIIRCRRALQHPRDRSEGGSSSGRGSSSSKDAAPTAAADQAAAQQTLSAARDTEAALGNAAAAAGATGGGKGSARKCSTGRQKAEIGVGSKMKQTNMACFVRPRPVAPPILGTGTAGGSVTPNSNTPGVSAADKPAAVAGAGSSIVRQPAAAAAAIAASQLGVGSSNAGQPTVAAAAGAATAGGVGGAPEAGAGSDAAKTPDSSADAAADSKKRKVAELVDRAGFGGFEDQNGWLGYVPSAASVIGLFITESELPVAVACFRQLRVGGQLWKGDHNYKFVKCVRSNGQMVYAAVFTLMNVSMKPGQGVRVY